MCMTSLWSSCMHTQSDRMIAEIKKQHDDCWEIQTWYDIHLHNASGSTLVVVQKPDDVCIKTIIRVEQWPAARCHASWLDNTLATPCCSEWGMAWTTHQKQICMTSPWSSYVHTQSDWEDRWDAKAIGKIAEMQKLLMIMFMVLMTTMSDKLDIQPIFKQYSYDLQAISKWYSDEVQVISRRFQRDRVISWMI